VLGSATHRGTQAYAGGEKDIATPADEGEAIKHGHQRGLDYLAAYSEGFINYTTTIPNRQKLEEKYAFCYFGYIKEFDYKNKYKEILLIEEKLKYTVEVEGHYLPVPLVSVPDLVARDHQGRIVIVDHKITAAYTKEDDIDGSKIIQAMFNYFTVYTHTGEAPYSFTFREFKHTKNADNSPQTREYTFVYNEVPMMFELFYRLYQDITDMLLGKAVFLPNFKAMWDKEVSILSYIYRLDVQEERNQAFKKMKVDNITDFLKEKIQKEGSIKKYMEQVASQFVSAKTLNYKDMTIEERIKMKLAEHGIGLEFHSKVEGYSVDLYKYEPSIGLKMSKIEGYTKDIEQVVEISGIRILAPIADSGLVGFEIPRKERRFPSGKPEANGFNLAMGVNTMGQVVRMDIREAPHIIVAGTTGSGKSVWLDSIIDQITDIPNAEVYLADPKFVELTSWRGAAADYADNPEDIEMMLTGLVLEMNDRYKILQNLGVKNIKDTDLTYKFLIFDEYGDVVSSKNDFTESIKNSILLLAQKARAAGIHVILTTQRPSVKIISGDIKANYPVRVAFKTASSIDSQVILDQGGAEKLLGKGDALLFNNGKVERIQGYNLN